MIQRKQTLYLLLAAIAGAATWFYPLSRTRVLKGDQLITATDFKAQSNYLLFILWVVIVLLALYCIVLFKKRKQQFKLTVLNIFLALASILLQYIFIKKSVNALSDRYVGTTIDFTYLLPAVLPVLIFIFLFMAARGIYKDEKLVKSLDRLR